MMRQSLLTAMAILVLMSPTELDAFPDKSKQLAVEEISLAIMDAIMPLTESGLKKENFTLNLSKGLLRDIGNIPTVLDGESNIIQQVFRGLKSASTPHFRKMMVLTSGFQDISDQISEFEDTCQNKMFTVNHGEGFQAEYQIPELVKPKDITIPVLPSSKQNDREQPDVDVSSLLTVAEGLEDAKQKTLNSYGADAYVSLKDLLTAAKYIQAAVEQKKRDALGARLVMHEQAVEKFVKVNEHAGSIESIVHQLNSLVNAFNVDAMAAAKTAVRSISGDMHRTACVAM